MADDVILVYGQSHTVWTCPDCGVIATCPTRLYDRQRKVGGYHSCPNGHQWGWDKEGSEDERIRRERDLLKQQMAQKDDEIRQVRAEWDAAERRAKEASTKHVNARKRAGSGTCPCCKRTFSQVARHMATKHPTFKAEMINAKQLKRNGTIAPKNEVSPIIMEK